MDKHMHKPLLKGQFQPCRGSHGDSCTCGYIFTEDGKTYLAKIIGKGEGADPYMGNDDKRREYQKLLAAAPKYKRERDALLEALEPFAQAARDAMQIGQIPSDKQFLWKPQRNVGPDIRGISYADCEKARTAIAACKEDKDG